MAYPCSVSGIQLLPTLSHTLPVILGCFPAVEECLRSSLPEMEATSDALGRCPLKGFKSQTGK